MPVDVRPDVERVSVWEGLRIVTSRERQLTPQEAAELAAGGDAESIDSPARVLGRGTSPYWASFSLRNPASSWQTRLLALEATTQFDTRLFERDPGGAWRQVASLADAAAGRIGAGTTHPVWKLHLAPRQTVDLLLRVEGPAIVRFPVFAYSPASFVESERRTHIAIGVTLGICLLVGVYIGSLRRYLDDASIPLFIGMLIADMVGALWLSGFLSETFPALPESTLSPIGIAALNVLLGCGCLHASVYLSVASWSPRADRLLRGLGWSCLALAPWFALAFPLASRVLIVWSAFAVAFTLIAVSVAAARRKIPCSAFIAAAWMAYGFVAASFLVARVGSNPSLWSSNVLVLIQATLTAILFGLAMSQRLLRQRDSLVTARQEAQMQHEKVAALMRERSLLFAATSHDLRQPMFGVGLFAELLKSSRTEAERQEHARKLDMALKEVDGLLIGIQQLAAINEASHHPDLETVKLDDVLAPVIEEYRLRAAYKRIAIRFVRSRHSITTHVPYFQRIVRNVLSNAIRYTDQGGRILVGCRRSGGLRLVIADTGRGMTEEQARGAFDAFQRFDPEESVSDGFGLGLFSTKSLAHSLGMSVSLHSHTGRGTQFTLLIPAVSESA